jgi:hypothetical protein
MLGRTRQAQAWRVGLGLLAGVLAIALGGAARAGSWAVVTLDRENALLGSSGKGIVAGESFIIGFTVLQHGERPMVGLTPRITATHAASGETAAFTATADGPAGHYAATLTLPRAGAWAWQIDAYGFPAVMAPLAVLEPAPAASPARLPVALPVAALLAALTAAGLLLAQRARQRTLAT